VSLTIDANRCGWQDDAVALIDAQANRIDSRVVVCGPARAGKSAWLQQVCTATGSAEAVQSVGEEPGAVPHELLWIELGEIRGYNTRFQLTSVAGAPEEREHRRMLLQHVDGIVFVADATPGRDRDNAASFSELETLLGDWGTPLSGIPLVVFVNKSDLPGALTVEEVARQLGRGDAALALLPGSATTGDGVLDSFKAIAKLVLGTLAKSD
jgi:signal recognition particle receptor subunit beta